MVLEKVVAPPLETYQLVLAVWLQLVPVKLTSRVAGADTVNVSVFPDVMFTPFVQDAVTVLTGKVPEHSVKFKAVLEMVTPRTGLTLHPKLRAKRTRNPPDFSPPNTEPFVLKGNMILSSFFDRVHVLLTGVKNSQLINIEQIKKAQRTKDNLQFLQHRRRASGAVLRMGGAIPMIRFSVHCTCTSSSDLITHFALRKRIRLSPYSLYLYKSERHHPIRFHYA